jgi:hypothetical protein
LEKYIADILSAHSGEIKSLAWKVAPVLVGAEFIARMFMAGYDVFKKNVQKEYREKVSRFTGLTANGIIAFVFVITSVSGASNIVYGTCLYAGATTALDFSLHKLIKKYFRDA